MRSITRRSKWSFVILFVIFAVLINGCAITQNNAPIISDMQPEKSWVELSGTCRIECTATDPDGNELTYEWSANNGSISGTDSTANWVAPEARGLYIITVLVSDGRGGETRMDLPILVSINQEPIIDNLTAELTVCNSNDITPIDCVAYDPDGDELEYTWEVTGGSISSDGAFAVWTASEEYDYYYITVTVTDGRGGKTEDEIHIKVSDTTSSDCGCGS